MCLESFISQIKPMQIPKNPKQSLLEAFQLVSSKYFELTFYFPPTSLPGIDFAPLMVKFLNYQNVTRLCNLYVHGLLTIYYYGRSQA